MPPAPEFTTQNILLLLNLVAEDSAALNYLLLNDINNFRIRFAELAGSHGLQMRWDGERTLRTFASWCGQRADLDPRLQNALAKRKESIERLRREKRTLVRESGINWSQERRLAFIDSLPVKVVTALKKEYPPFDHCIADSEEIAAKWREHFRTGYQPDKRLKRLSVHVINSQKLQLDIPEAESCILHSNYGDLVGIVIRNMCGAEDLVKWADSIVEKTVSLRRNIRVSYFTQN